MIEKGIHPGLSNLLRALQLQKLSERKVSPKQLAACVTLLFPKPANQPKHGVHNSSARCVSPGWQDALALLELSRCCDSSCAQERMSESDHLSNEVETDTAETILNLGRFPLHSGGWVTALSVLERWRKLQGPEHGRSFPKSLSVSAAADLAYLFSFSKPTGERITASWQEVLGLYQHAVQHTMNSGSDSRTSHSLLRSMRHTASSALLHNGEWLRALHLFTHALYQRDAPGSVSTGHLIQHLGKVRQWEAILQIYQLCVALVQRERMTPNYRQSAELQRRLAKQWGTTTSMAMAAVSKECCQPHLLLPMLETLLHASDKLSHSSSSRSGSFFPLVQLDGNFLEAVDCIKGESERAEILQKARQSNLLDYYKLIRGLTSKGKLDEAMTVFIEGIRSDPPSLTRREIGLSRLHLLHASPLEHIEETVATLNRVGGRRHSTPLLLNDSEVECVLSKALQTTTSPPKSPLPASSTSTSVAKAHSSTFWRYCLQILQTNYEDFLRDGAMASRKPTLASLSFFLRNVNLPWQIALLIVRQQRDLHEESSFAASQSQDAPSLSTAIVNNATDEVQSVQTRVLLLNAAAQLLYDQGQSSRADDLSLSVIQDFQSSPSATFLMRCSWLMLARVLLQEGVSVDSRVLYHILHDRSYVNNQDPSSSLRPFAIVSFVMDTHATDGRGSWLPNTVLARVGVDVNLKRSSLERKQQASGVVFGSSFDKQPSRRSWLACMPGAIHVEVLKRLSEPVPWGNEELRWELVVSYLGCLAPPLPPLTTAHSPVHTKLHERHYCAVYEGVLTLLELLPNLARAGHPQVSGQFFRGGGPHHAPLGSPSGQANLRLLQQLLEHAITPWGLVPPAHMLLPSQTDRLLPRSLIKGKRDDLRVGTMARCVVAEALVRASCHVLRGRAESSLASFGPVTFHRLLKLCCRVAEVKAGWELPGDTKELESCAEELIRWQSESCGVHTVHPGSLLMLYKLCAVRDQQWERALRVTKRLLELEEKANREEEMREGGGVCLPEGSLHGRVNRAHAHYGKRVVQPSHYHAYYNLFGWERGLQLWFDHFPSEVMQRVSGNPVALNWCFSASDTEKK